VKYVSSPRPWGEVGGAKLIGTVSPRESSGEGDWRREKSVTRFRKRQAKRDIAVADRQDITSAGGPDGGADAREIRPEAVVDLPVKDNGQPRPVAFSGAPSSFRQRPCRISTPTSVGAQVSALMTAAAAHRADDEPVGVRNAGVQDQDAGVAPPREAHHSTWQRVGRALFQGVRRLRPVARMKMIK